MGQSDDGSTNKTLPFNAIIGDGLNITLETVFKISEMLAFDNSDGKQDGFFPWLDWNLPFADTSGSGRIPAGGKKPLVSNETVSMLNDAYHILNESKDDTRIRYMNIRVKDIEPNPFWNLKSDPLMMSRIKFWAIVIKEADISAYPDCIMAVRPYEEKYQTVNHHHQLAALRLLRIENIRAPLMNLSDEEMRRRLQYESVVT